MKNGRIFVISAPSGSGKTTICKKVLKKVKSLTPSVSVTTRRPRKGEKNKRDYYYVSRRSFKEKIKKGSLLEWEENFGYFYGTPKRFAIAELKKGKNLLLSIDVKGAMQVKKKFPESTLIFIRPPSFKELSRRLTSRNTDKPREIARRLKIAKAELKFMPKYNYAVTNDKLENAILKVVSIIKKESKTE
ncbi:MAG: guanylate kinase [Candidatus Omnitrophica bacterium]|nr:guanylate kinase [Candidatus Omnitrophota bacterium]